VARRWGPAIGGLLVSLPLTSGPVLFFLALDQGSAFAADAAVGTLLGLGAIVAYSLGYLLASRRGAWASIASASVAYALAAIVATPIHGLPFVLLALGVTAAIAGALRVLPPPGSSRSEAPHPSWDLPARVVVGTGLVLGLTAVAPLLGPFVSGIVATFPVYVSVLAVFTHLREGPRGATDVLRGLLTGLFGTVAFYLVVHVLVEPAGIVVAFAAAIAVTLAIAGLALRVVRAGIAAAAA
jgi:hypothetical protein